MGRDIEGARTRAEAQFKTPVAPGDGAEGERAASERALREKTARLREMRLAQEALARTGTTIRADRRRGG